MLLNAESVYIRLAGALSSVDFSLSGDGDNAIIFGTVGDQGLDSSSYLEFVGTMVQTLNLILLTAPELHGLRSLLSKSFAKNLVKPVQKQKLKKLPSGLRCLKLFISLELSLSGW